MSRYASWQLSTGPKPRAEPTPCASNFGARVLLRHAQRTPWEEQLLLYTVGVILLVALLGM